MNEQINKPSSWRSATGKIRALGGKTVKVGFVVKLSNDSKKEFGIINDSDSVIVYKYKSGLTPQIGDKVLLKCRNNKNPFFLRSELRDNAQISAIIN